MKSDQGDKGDVRGDNWDVKGDNGDGGKNGDLNGKNGGLNGKNGDFDGKNGGLNGTISRDFFERKKSAKANFTAWVNRTTKTWVVILLSLIQRRNFFTKS
jgi:hypothetical protein